MVNRPTSIKKALQLGIVTRVERPLCYDSRSGYQIYVKYFKPIYMNNRWRLKGDWFQCSEKYFNSYVRKHCHFRA